MTRLHRDKRSNVTCDPIALAIVGEHLARRRRVGLARSHEARDLARRLDRPSDKRQANDARDEGVGIIAIRLHAIGDRVESHSSRPIRLA